MRKTRKKVQKTVILHRRRVIITSLLIVIAGLGALFAFVLTQRVKADVDFDPYFSLSTGDPKIRIFQPLHKSVDNDSNFTASGTAPPGTTISLTVDGVGKGTTTTNNSGQWTKAISGISDGEHTLTANTTLGGPFSVIGAQSLVVPSYAVVDLSTNGMTTASTIGLATTLYDAFGNQSFGQGSLYPINVFKVSSRYAYIVRPRSVTIFDVLQQKTIKTITLSSQFLTEGDSSVDTGESFKHALVSTDGGRVYLLYSDGDTGKIVAIDTATQTLISGSGFPASTTPNATQMVQSPDGLQLFTIAYNSNQFDVISTLDGTSSQLTLGGSARDMVASADNSTIYISKAIQDGSYYIALYDVGGGTLDDLAIDLGTSLEGSTLYASGNDTVYATSSYDTTFRVFDRVSKLQTATIDLPALVLEQTKQIARNDSETRAYIPLQDNTIAMVNLTANELIGVINPPGDNYTGPAGLMYYDGSLYASYARTPSLGDIYDISGLFSSLTVANANASGSTTASALTVNGVASGSISQPLDAGALSLESEVTFSVGDPVTITGPLADSVLDTSTPTITGTGPKGATIQLTVNSGSPVNVAVDQNGNWQKVVSLQKNKTNNIAVLYNNKRSQLVLPNLFVFGADIAKNQLSVIDGQSGLEQQPVTLPTIGINNLRLNLSAAMNPNGQRYYVSNVDFATFLADHIDLLSSYLGGTTPDPGDADILLDLLDAQLGSVDVYSTQTKQKISQINLPLGTVPIGITISPDGTRAFVQVFNIENELNLLTAQEPLTGAQPSPLQFVPIDLDTNEVSSDPIDPTINVDIFGGDDSGFVLGTSIASAAVNALSKAGVFSNDGEQFFVPAFSANVINSIDTETNELTTLDIQSDPETTTVPLGMQTSTVNNVLYVSYLDVRPPAEGESFPYLAPGMMLIDLDTDEIISKTPTPTVPLFNFVIGNTGAKAYMVTLNLEEIIEKVTTGIANQQAVFADSLPTFYISTLDIASGTLTSKAVTNTEIPYNPVLSPDGTQVFMPTLLHNTVHMYDITSDTVDPGNYPVVLGGLSTALATTSNTGSALLGSYNASATYYVPADAPVTQDPESTTTIIEKTFGATEFRNLPANNATTTTLAAEDLAIPNQVVQVVRDTAQQALESQRTTNVAQNRTLLIYAVYAALVSVLGLTGFAIWKTDVLLGGAEAEEYV